MTIKERVIALRERDPSIKAIRMAEIIGCSNERVRQILNQVGMPSAFPQRKIFFSVCKKCNQTFQARRGDKSFSKQHRQMCYDCYNKKITLNCDWCNKEFVERFSLMQVKLKRGYNHLYCSKKCSGQGGIGQYQRNKTHCPRGHAYVSSNIRKGSSPYSRICKRCESVHTSPTQQLLEDMPLNVLQDLTHQCIRHCRIKQSIEVFNKYYAGKKKASLLEHNTDSIRIEIKQI